MHCASFQSPACRFVAKEPEARWTGSGERGQKKGGRKNGYHRAPSTDEHNGGLDSVQGAMSLGLASRSLPRLGGGAGRWTKFAVDWSWFEAVVREFLLDPEPFHVCELGFEGFSEGSHQVRARERRT